MLSRRRTIAVAAAAAMWLALTSAITASEELNRAKDLYRSASYDEALNLLDSLPAAAESSEALEAREYRVLCLVALDRRDDAKKAMATLIAAEPLYAMSETEASPRVRTMFTEVRRATLPSVIQAAYADAKAMFDRKDPKAAAGFDRVLTLLKDPDAAGNAGLADLATVASGFRDLSKALATTAPAPPPAANPLSAAAPPPSAPSATSIGRTATPSAAPVLVPPVAIAQPIPVPQMREERE